MDDTARRLAKCFQAVFPGLAEDQIPSASQARIDAWDSIATITLGNVVEEEFGVEMDFERLAELNSFDQMLAWVQSRRGSC